MDVNQEAVRLVEAHGSIRAAGIATAVNDIGLK
jgi:hypothetical protein